jgi:hypothetical protein
MAYVFLARYIDSQNFLRVLSMEYIKYHFKYDVV